MQAGLAAVWPYTHELFNDGGQQPVPGVAVPVAGLRAGWSQFIEAVLSEATLEVPPDDGWRPGGGRKGLHTEAMGYLLAEMQHLNRAHPGARW
jgi:ring-1,2-phenylacetyl-CoA epoxidase subunit PaaC